MKFNELLLDWAQLDFIIIKNKPCIIQVYSEVGGGKELSFHLYV
jgi:hypothetical protein